MAALFSRILLIPIQIITFFWAKNYFGLISAWVAETEQMPGPKGDEFDMSSENTASLPENTLSNWNDDYPVSNFSSTGFLKTEQKQGSQKIGAPTAYTGYLSKFYLSLGHLFSEYY